MKDRYDAAIEYFTEHPEEIRRAWTRAGTHPHGKIFAFCTSSRGADFMNMGCPLMVRGGYYDAETTELTKEIRADDRIPKSVQHLGLETLPVLAEWQRKLDIALDRK